MKYWRGYLVAAVMLVFTLALMKFAEANSVLIDMVYPYVTRMVQSTLAQWSSGAAFCLWQVLLIVLGIGVLASIVLMIVLRWNPIQWFGWVLTVASAIFLLHTGIYGLNNYAGPLAEDIRLETTEYSILELKEATVYYRDKANALAAMIQRDENSNPEYPTFEEMADQAGEGFENLVYQDFQPAFAGSTMPVKKLGWADMYTSMGITGITMPITGESAVNPQIPAVSMPFTMCHEMARRMCIAVERDADFAAFLACDANSSLEFQYSAYFMAYRYCADALTVLSPGDAAGVAAGQSALLTRDLTTCDSFFKEKRSDKAAKLAAEAKDAYINASGDGEEVTSWGNVCDLLVSWHIQTVVIPAQITEEEDKFDPYDESKIDLTVTPVTEPDGAING